MALSHVQYPSSAIDEGIEGTVTLCVEIDSTCSIANKKILDGLNETFDKAVLRAIPDMAKTIWRVYHSRCIPNTDTLLVKFELPR